MNENREEEIVECGMDRKKKNINRRRKVRQKAHSDISNPKKICLEKNLSLKDISNDVLEHINKIEFN